MLSPMSPVSNQPTAPRAYAAPQAPQAAPAQQAQAPQVYAQPGQPVAATGLSEVINGLFSAVGKVLTGIFNFFQRLFSGAPGGANAGFPAPAPGGQTQVPGPVAQPQLPAPAPTTPTTPAPAGELSAEEAAIAQQQGILATRANFDAFIKEAQALEAENAMGPGSTDTEAVKELQTLLSSWGYPVQASGQFDQATVDAVLKFKQDNNLTGSYQMADGTPGVHPFIDEKTKAAMIAKLQAAEPAQPAPAPAPTPAPATQYQGAVSLSAEEQAIAQEQGILATRENFDLFIKEAQALEAINALGPGTTETEMVKELQQVLAGWGYTVQSTGQFDQATVDAVIKFKRDHNLVEGYQMADGTPGVHPFIDEETKQAMIAKLSA